MPDSAKAVYAAVAGNVAVCVTKFVAAAATGSSAMLAEAFHSVADTANDLLLLLGQKRSRRPPDRNHPFGHGQELYFWSLLVAIVVFAVGAGFSFYEGITRILNPSRAEKLLWSYIVLGLAAVFEGLSLTVGLRQFRKEAGRRSLWRTVRESKDPTTFSVVLEDSAALIGLGLAFTGIWSAQHFHLPALDGAASVAIGVLLTAVSMVLARESKGLLLGEALSPREVEELRELIQACKGVQRAACPLTMYFGPDAVMAAIDVQFAPGLSGEDVAETVDRIEETVRRHNPKIKRIFIEAQALGAPLRQRKQPG